jgi:hypothetical protein
MPIAVSIDAPRPHALKYGVHTDTAGQVTDALDRLLAALADDVGGAELSGELGALGVAAHDDDLLDPQSLGGDHAAQPDGAVADDGHGLSRANLRDNGCVVAGAHHIREGQ